MSTTSAAQPGATSGEAHSLTRGGLRSVVSQPNPRVDVAAAEAAAAHLLVALGLELSDESSCETPRRMAHALIEMTSGPEFELTTFPNDEGYDELVLVRDIA
ncbi:MAG: GTP cyclohydrolase I, partial [Nocardioidaceae bacterium]|nr:GTP cyclohydrolase I [Nocardioidaceae bacterium]